MARFRVDTKRFTSGARRAARNPRVRNYFSKVGRRVYDFAKKRGGARTKRVLAAGAVLYKNRKKIKEEIVNVRDMFYGTDEQKYNQRGFAKKGTSMPMAGTAHRVHKSKISIGSNGRKLRQLRGLYGSTSKEIRNTQNDAIETNISTTTGWRQDIGKIQAGFNQKLWIFPLHAGVEMDDLADEYDNIRNRDQVDTTRVYGHMLNFKRKLMIASGNSFLDMVVNIYTCKFNDNQNTIDGLYNAVIPPYLSSPSQIVAQGQGSAIPQIKLLEAGQNSAEQSTRAARQFSMLSALVDPDARLDSSRFFEDHVKVIKKTTQKLSAGDILSHRTEEHPRKPMPLDGVFRADTLEEDGPVGTFDIIEVVGKRVEGYVFSGVGSSREPHPYIGTGPVQVSLEYQVMMEGVNAPIEASSSDNNTYSGTFSYQVYQTKPSPLRIGNLDFSKIGSYEQAADETVTDVHMYIPVSTEEHIRYAHPSSSPRVATPVASETDANGDLP